MQIWDRSACNLVSGLSGTFAAYGNGCAFRWYPAWRFDVLRAGPKFAREPDAVLAGWKSGDWMLAGLLAIDMRLARAAEWMTPRVSWSDSVAKRGMRALEILAHPGNTTRITSHHHAVQSCSDPSKKYNVKQKGCRWSCDCLDYGHRQAQCKHILATIYHVVEREEAALGMHDTPADHVPSHGRTGSPTFTLRGWKNVRKSAYPAKALSKTVPKPTSLMRAYGITPISPGYGPGAGSHYM